MSEAKSWADLGPGAVTFGGGSAPKKPAEKGPPRLSPKDQANYDARLREKASLPEPPDSTGWVTLDRLPELVARRERAAAKRQEIEAASTKDRAKVDAMRKEHSKTAVAAMVAGKAADFSAVAVAEQELESREAPRRHEAAAALAAEQAIEESIRVSLAASVRTLYKGMREGRERFVRTQVELATQLLAVLVEEQEMERRALGEIGRVRKVLPDLQLGPEYEEIPGEQLVGTDGRGTKVLMGAKPATRRQLDTPDLKILRRFLEDGFVGVPSLISSRRNALESHLRAFLTAARDEGYHA